MLITNTARYFVPDIWPPSRVKELVDDSDVERGGWMVEGLLEFFCQVSVRPSEECRAPVTILTSYEPLSDRRCRFSISILE